jgi:hypothetical protein
MGGAWRAGTRPTRYNHVQEAWCQGAIGDAGRLKKAGGINQQEEREAAWGLAGEAKPQSGWQALWRRAGKGQARKGDQMGLARAGV